MGVSSRPSISDSLRVPFVDLAFVNAAVKRRVLERLAEAIDRGDFINGEAVAEFERQFALHCGRAACVGVASGLDALRLTLAATGLAPGAAVVTPAATFAATFEAIVQAGGVPLVADVADGEYTLDLGAAAAWADATHVMPVHLYGQMTDMRTLADVAREHDLVVIEDACQSHGAERDGLVPGEAARAAAFSFYPAKNLGAMGDAGAVVTDDEALADAIRSLRQHGETRKYHHEAIGYTARLDTFQAIVLLEKLSHLDEWNAQRRTVTKLYEQELARVDGLRLPAEAPGSRSAWHLYVVRVDAPDELADYLRSRDIHTGRHYPEPPHLAPAYRHLGYAPGDFPVAEALSREGLSLPLFPGMSDAQVDHVCRALRDYFGAS